MYVKCGENVMPVDGYISIHQVSSSMADSGLSFTFISRGIRNNMYYCKIFNKGMAYNFLTSRENIFIKNDEGKIVEKYMTEDL